MAEPGVSRPGRQTTVRCPGCGTRQQVPVDAVFAGNEFCAKCDYPLFWAPIEQVVRSVNAARPDAPPKTSEARQVVVCTREGCGEPNPVEWRSATCARCGAPLPGTS